MGTCRDPALGRPYRIRDPELASRLSFFLWISIPGDELLGLAIVEELGDSTGRLQPDSLSV